MITYTRIQAVFIYFYVGMFGLTAFAGFVSGLFGGDEGLMGLSLIMAPTAYVLHLFAQAHFRLATRAQNYINFCKAIGINDDKEHTEKFFTQFKLTLK